MRSTPHRSVPLLLVGLSLAAGCAIRSEDPEPKEVALAVKFPSIEAAATVDNVEVLVLAPGAGCAEVMRQRRLGENPATILTSGRINVCDFVSGSARVEIPIGEHLLIAIARRGEAEVFSGCVEQFVGDGDVILPIPLSRSDNGTVRLDASCSLAAFCSGQCQ